MLEKEVNMETVLGVEGRDGDGGGGRILLSRISYPSQRGGMKTSWQQVWNRVREVSLNEACVIDIGRLEQDRCD